MDLITWASQKLQRMRNKCDHDFAREYPNKPELRPSMHVEEFIFMTAQLFFRLMSMWSKQIDHALWPEMDICLDESGLPLLPTINMLLNVSFGHRVHGKEMLSGYTTGSPTREDHFAWRYEHANVDYETQCRNLRRWDRDNEYISMFEDEDFNLRCFTGNQIGPLVLPSGPIDFGDLVLRDELAIQYVEDDGRWRMIDETIYTIREDVLRLTMTDVQLPSPQSSQEQSPVTQKQASATESPKSSHKPQELVNQPSKQPRDGQPAPARNFARMNNSCWFSVILQIFHKIPQLRALFRDPNMGCLSITGRHDSDFEAADDANGVKHDALVKYLIEVLNELDRATTAKVSTLFVKVMISRSNAVSRVEEFNGNDWESCRHYLTYLLARLSTACDRSASAIDLGHPTDMPLQQLSAFRRHASENGQPQIGLLEDADKEWHAWTALGRRSDLIDLTCAQTVEERVCVKCGTVKREFFQEQAITLIVPGAVGDSVFDLAALREEWLNPADDYDAQAATHSATQCRAAHLGCPGRLSTIRRRVTRFPELLFMHLEPGLRDTKAHKAEWSHVDISDHQSLSAADYSKYAELPSEVYEQDKPRPSKDEYELCGAVLTRRGGVDHFLLYLRDQDNPKMFVCYDDLQDAPFYTQLLRQFDSVANHPTILIYRKLSAGQDKSQTGALAETHLGEGLEPKSVQEIASSPPVAASEFEIFYPGKGGYSPTASIDFGSEGLLGAGGDYTGSPIVTPKPSSKPKEDDMSSITHELLKEHPEQSEDEDETIGIASETLKGKSQKSSDEVEAEPEHVRNASKAWILHCTGEEIRRLRQRLMDHGIEPDSDSQGPEKSLRDAEDQLVEGQLQLISEREALRAEQARLQQDQANFDRLKASQVSAAEHQKPDTTREEALEHCAVTLSQLTSKGGVTSVDLLELVLQKLGPKEITQAKKIIESKMPPPTIGRKQSTMPGQPQLGVPIPPSTPSRGIKPPAIESKHTHESGKRTKNPDYPATPSRQPSSTKRTKRDSSSFQGQGQESPTKPTGSSMGSSHTAPRSVSATGPSKPLFDPRALTFQPWSSTSTTTQSHASKGEPAQLPSSGEPGRQSPKKFLDSRPSDDAPLSSIKGSQTLPRSFGKKSMVYLTSKKEPRGPHLKLNDREQGLLVGEYPLACPRYWTHACTYTHSGTWKDTLGHVAEDHDDKPPYYCPYAEERDCPLMFKTHKEVDEHVADVHKQKDLFKCVFKDTDCKQEFRDDSDRVAHLARHQRCEKSMRCPFCQLSFADKSTKLRHLRRTHAKQGLKSTSPRQDEIVTKILPDDGATGPAWYKVEYEDKDVDSQSFPAHKVMFELLYSYELLLPDNDETVDTSAWPGSGGQPGGGGDGGGDEMDTA